MIQCTYDGCRAPLRLEDADGQPLLDADDSEPMRAIARARRATCAAGHVVKDNLGKGRG